MKYLTLNSPFSFTLIWLGRSAIKVSNIAPVWYYEYITIQSYILYIIYMWQCMIYDLFYFSYQWFSEEANTIDMKRS